MLDEAFRHIEEKTADNSWLLIGECGLDRLCTTPYAIQRAAFEAQIALSEQWCRPLVLHCVRALDDVLQLKRKTIQPWIWHGFRGKPEQLRQLLNRGFYVSFGFRFNEESLRSCPLNRLFLETDDEPRPVHELYHTVASLLGITEEHLIEQLWINVHSLFSSSTHGFQQ